MNSQKGEKLLCVTYRADWALAQLVGGVSWGCPGGLLGAPGGLLGALLVLLGAPGGTPNSQNVLFGHP